MRAWMREIQVILTSTSLKKRMTFGDKDDNLNIDISGYKYLSSLKDNFTVKISNLTYREILELISGKYYDIEIKCGYKSASVFTVFKGAVIYISNSLGDKKTNEAIILCGSKLVASFGQSRMNLSLQSGINMYSALNFLCKRAGVRNSNVDTEFKSRIIREVSDANVTIGSFLDTFANDKGFCVNSDSSVKGADVSIWDPYRKDSRVIVLDSSNVILSGGLPTLTTEGLRITLIPTTNFMPGDTIKIDNSIIDISSASKDEAFTNKGYFMDESGKYIIYEIEMHLQNRGSDFSYSMLCKSKNLFSKIAGGNR